MIVITNVQDVEVLVLTHRVLCRLLVILQIVRYKLTNGILKQILRAMILVLLMEVLGDVV